MDVKSEIRQWRPQFIINPTALRTSIDLKPFFDHA
jgi:hypothetical protein